MKIKLKSIIKNKTSKKAYFHVVQKDEKLIVILEDADMRDLDIVTSAFRKIDETSYIICDDRMSFITVPKDAVIQVFNIEGEN